MIFSKMRVLLVDDEPMLRTFVSELLHQIGVHQIHEAVDGKSALLEAIKFQPDLVLSDIHMEPMDGIEFVKKLRALPKPYFAHVPVILMTADTNKETLTEAIPYGIMGYMIKPPQAAGLKTKVEQALWTPC